MSLPKIDNLNLKELNDLEDKIAERKAKLKQTAESDYLAEIKNLAEERGLDFKEMTAKISGSKLKIKAPAKYRDPDNSENEWSGRGKRPVWFNKRIEAGDKPEDLLIK